MPDVWGFPDATLDRASDEHGRIVPSIQPMRCVFGDKIRLVPAIATRPEPARLVFRVRGDRVERCGRWPRAAVLT